VNSGKQQEPRVLHGQVGDGVEHSLGDEGERSFRADQHVLENVYWALEIDKRIQRVPGGVLHAVFGADALIQSRIRFNLPLQLEQSFSEARFFGAELLISADISCVDHRPGRQHEREGTERVVRVLSYAAAHPAGVVGEDATDHACTNRRRIRADLHPEGPQYAVDISTDHSGLYAHFLAVVFDR
jgi:hypothetical protein